MGFASGPVVAPLYSQLSCPPWSQPIFQPTRPRPCRRRKPRLQLRRSCPRSFPRSIQPTRPRPRQRRKFRLQLRRSCPRSFPRSSQPTRPPSFIPTAGLEEAVDTCPVEWNCDGHCYRLIGRKPKCHRKKTSESKCHKKKNVWCPERGDQAF